MLPNRLYIRFNAADAYARFEKAGESIPSPSVTPEELQRVLAKQADKLFALNGYPSLDSTDNLTVSLMTSSSPDELCVYDRESKRDPQTNRPTEVSRFVVSDSPPPSVTSHGDIHFWLDEVQASSVDR